MKDVGGLLTMRDRLREQRKVLKACVPDAQAIRGNEKTLIRRAPPLRRSLPHIPAD